MKYHYCLLFIENHRKTELTLPTGGPCCFSNFIFSSKSFANSKILMVLDEPVMPAVYPKVEIRALLNSGSRVSHGGQKFRESCSHDQDFHADPPRPWMKMMSTTGFSGEVTDVNPKGSFGPFLELPPPCWLKPVGNDNRFCDDRPTSGAELLLPLLSMLFSASRKSEGSSGKEPNSSSPSSRVLS